MLYPPLHLRLGGERISTTVEHPFFVAGRGWVKAGELALGEKVLRADDAAVGVTEIEHQTEFADDVMPIVYNMEVGEWHTYLVGKWLWWVHNATICLSTGFKKVAKVVKDKKKQLLTTLPSKVKSKRLQYLGKTPGKASKTGREVIERMKKEGKLREINGKAEILGADGKWHSVDKTDMGHIDDAVTYWNREGRQHGPKSKEVRDWMKDPDNYELEPSSINRSKGGKLKEKYLPPLK